MDGRTQIGFPTALDLVQRSLEDLRRKRRLEGLGPVEDVRYRNLLELEDALLGRAAS